MHHQRGGDVHHQTHECHDDHAERYGHAGETLREHPPPGALALPDQCRGGVGDSVAGHVTKAFGGDGK